MPSSSGGEAEPIDMKRNIALCLGLALGISAAASSALAHHSHPYFYDSCKTITVEGRVNSVQWKDPHTLIEVKLDDGTAYSVDWAGLSALTRDGIAGPAQAALPFGARITVTGNPIRTAAQIREHFPDFPSEVNSKTIDPMRIRRLDGSWSWSMRADGGMPPCPGK